MNNQGEGTMNKTPEGYVPMPRIEVVEIPNHISTRSAWEVRVNGNHAGRWPDRESADGEAERIRSWFRPKEVAPDDRHWGYFPPPTPSIFMGNADGEAERIRSWFGPEEEASDDEFMGGWV